MRDGYSSGCLKARYSVSIGARKADVAEHLRPLSSSRIEYSTEVPPTEKDHNALDVALAADL